MAIPDDWCKGSYTVPKTPSYHVLKKMDTPMTPKPDEDKVPEVLIVGTLEKDLIVTYKDQVIILDNATRIKEGFTSAEQIKKYVKENYALKPAQILKKGQVRTSKPIGGNPKTLRARKKLLEQKLRGKRDQLTKDSSS